jgi:cytochrome c biogenesis protein CcdA
VHLVEAVAGGVIVAFAVVLWFARRSLARRLAGSQLKAGRSAFLLGAGIMSGELPTAVPYFGALAAITAGDHRAVTIVALVLVYNALFVAPMVVLLGILVAAGERGALTAARLRERLTGLAPLVFPPALALLGLVLLVLGAAGLAR